MDIRASLQKEHSKEMTKAIIAHIGSDEGHMAELMACFFDEDNRLSQRAAWPLGIIGEKQPRLLYPYLGKMIEQLGKKQKHNAIHRNVLRTLQFMIIPEEHQGSLLNHCTDFLIDPKAATAVKAFSLSVFHNLSKEIPELKNELRHLIELNLPYATSGVKARAHRILKQLDG